MNITDTVLTYILSIFTLPIAEVLRIALDLLFPTTLYRVSKKITINDNALIHTDNIVIFTSKMVGRTKRPSSVNIILVLSKLVLGRSAFISESLL